MPGQGRPRRAQGVKGDKGDRGPKGYKGNKGDTGPVGPPGPPTKADVTKADVTLELESEDSDDDAAPTGEVTALNVRIIESTGEAQMFFRRAKKNTKLYQGLRHQMAGNSTRVSHALTNFDKAKCKREDLLTEVKAVSYQNFLSVMAAKKQQQNRGNHKTTATLKKCDEDQIEYVNDVAGASLLPMATCDLY